MLLAALLTPILAIALVRAEPASDDRSIPALKRPGSGCDMQCIRAPCPTKPWCCDADYSCPPSFRCIYHPGAHRCCPPGERCGPPITYPVDPVARDVEHDGTARDPVTWPGLPVARDKEEHDEQEERAKLIGEGAAAVARKQRSVEDPEGRSIKTTPELEGLARARGMGRRTLNSVAEDMNRLAARGRELAQARGFPHARAPPVCGDE